MARYRNKGSRRSFRGGFRRSYRSVRRGSSSIFKSIFNFAKRPAGMLLIAACMILPFLFPKLGEIANGLASKIKKS